MILEGRYTGFFHDINHARRSDTIVFTPPDEPHTEIHANALAYVSQALEEIGLGKRVRITVEEVE